MSCLRIHDFITGTTIALPPVPFGQRDQCDLLDILRPNRKAAALFSRHVQALEALQSNRKPEIAVQ